MRRLELDFRRSPAPPLWSWALLLSGVATLLGLLVANRQIAEETATHLASIEHIETLLPGASRTARPADDAALSAARRTVSDSQQPWGELFAALEAADDKDVALLKLAPEPAKGQLKIQAEARNLGAMLAYHRRLEAGGALRRIALQEHDIARETAEAPVRFQIVADWGGKRGGP
ncbi:MAG: pilus assembly protein [Dechloromonas sp.]|nr:pilus assembly protein [Dechloromonas sp.]